MVPAFTFAGIVFHSFTLFLFLGYFCAALVLFQNVRTRMGGQYWKTMFFMGIISLVCGLYGAHLLSSLEHARVSELLSGNLKPSGKSFLGGILLGLPVMYIYFVLTKKDKEIGFGSMILPIIIGYSIGRIGCFLSGDGCYGIESDLPWCMSFPNGTWPTFKRVHPTPLYEVVTNFLLFIYFYVKIRRITEKYEWLSQTYIAAVLFSSLRFLVEFVRTNPTYFGFSMAQWISLVFVVLSTYLVVAYKKKTGIEGTDKDRHLPIG